MYRKNAAVAFFMLLTCFLLVCFVTLKSSCAAGPDGTSPVYRFYNTETGTHFFTIDEAEKDFVIANYPQFKYEGVAWYAYPPNGGGGTGDTAQWTVVNALSCKDGSPSTFEVTIDGVTRKSVKNGQGIDPTVESWAECSAGQKTYSYRLYGCGEISGNGPTISFEKGKGYIFISTITEDGNFAIKIEETSSQAPTVAPNNSQMKVFDVYESEVSVNDVLIKP